MTDDRVLFPQTVEKRRECHGYLAYGTGKFSGIFGRCVNGIGEDL